MTVSVCIVVSCHAWSEAIESEELYSEGMFGIIAALQDQGARISWCDVCLTSTTGANNHNNQSTWMS